MTDGNTPNTTKTYEIDIDDVGNVQDCTKVHNHSTADEVYATLAVAEPVYESPLNCGFMRAKLAQRRDSNGRKGRRVNTNDLYEATNDDSLTRGRAFTGYSYVTHTESIMPRLSHAHDNLVRATEGENVEHTYEDTSQSLRHSRFSENQVYDAQPSRPYTFEGIRDTRNGTKYAAHAYKTPDKRRITCIQAFTLLLSILAVLTGLTALLMASKAIKLNDDKNEPILTPAQLQTGRSTGENDLPDAPVTESPTDEKYLELLAKFNATKDEIESSKEKYDEIQAKYKELVERHTKLVKQFSESQKSVKMIQMKLNSTIQSVNLTLNTKLNNVDAEVLSLSKELVQFNTELKGVNMFSHQLGNSVKSLNSTFTTQLRNVSKQMGPRGFNGSQGAAGPQGPQGVGNMSACVVKQKWAQTLVTGKQKEYVNVKVSHTQTSGWKVMSAVCSTKTRAGASHAFLSVSGNDYTCTCAEPSTNTVYAPIRDKNGKKYMKCAMIYWQCPELTL